MGSGQLPHYLTKQQSAEPITNIQKVEGEAAELLVIKETLNDLIDKLALVFNRPGNVVSGFITSNVPIALNGVFQDIATLNITTTALGYLYGNAYVLWHPHANALATVSFKMIVDGETDEVVTTHGQVDALVSAFQYRSTIMHPAGTYPVTIQARLDGGPVTEVHHVDLFALGNLQ